MIHHILRRDARDRRRITAGIEGGRSWASASTDAGRCCGAIVVREAEPPVRDGAVRRLTFVAGPISAGGERADSLAPLGRGSHLRWEKYFHPFGTPTRSGT